MGIPLVYNLASTFPGSSLHIQLQGNDHRNGLAKAKQESGFTDMSNSITTSSLGWLTLGPGSIKPNRAKSKRVSYVNSGAALTPNDLIDNKSN